LFFWVLFLQSGYAQVFKFAHVTDTHVGNASGAEDLRNTVKDINANKDLEFVIISGDITEFGADHELLLAKQILDSLNKPWYVIPGNHDTNWSESGANFFNVVFGKSTFYFEHKGYLFIGTGSGPNMRMGPGQIPREDIVWLQETLAKQVKDRKPIIYINHYPQDSSLNNWYSAIDLLKPHNVQFMLCGHGHKNQLLSVERIPNVMGRSNLRAKDSIGGYNIITVGKDQVTFQEKRPFQTFEEAWLNLPLKDYQFHLTTQTYPRPSFSVNQKYPSVKEVWTYQDDSDLGSGISIYQNLAITANTKGEVYALDLTTGKRLWSFQSQGKIYSTPAVSGKYVVVGSSDNYIYGLSAKNGKLLWKLKTAKAVLGSPVIDGLTVFIGSSDGVFRAVNIKSGKLVWEYLHVEGFVVTKPLIYRNKIYFGSWGRYFYALDLKSGAEVWKWNNGSANRMFSPAACYPVAAYGKVFIVAPDRYMTAFDAETGEVIWRKTIADNRVRESMGISTDSSLVYAKTMDGKVFGVATQASEFSIIWNSNLSLPYEISPTAVLESNGLVFIPSHSGLASALDRESGKVRWQYKSSNSLINAIVPLENNRVLISTMDGKITCLKY